MCFCMCKTHKSLGGCSAVCGWWWYGELHTGGTLQCCCGVQMHLSNARTLCEVHALITHPEEKHSPYTKSSKIQDYYELPSQHISHHPSKVSRHQQCTPTCCLVTASTQAPHHHHPNTEYVLIAGMIVA